MISEHGIATHFIPARRIPDLRARLSSLENVTPDIVDAAIEELLDAAFSHGLSKR